MQPMRDPSGCAEAWQLENYLALSLCQILLKELIQALLLKVLAGSRLREIAWPN